MNFLTPKKSVVGRIRVRTTLMARCVALLAAPLFGQSDLAGASQGVSYSAPAVSVQDASDVQTQSPYLGGVPTGKASATPLSLSLEDSVARGLRQNLGGCFPATHSLEHKASGGEHSARCCPI